MSATRAYVKAAVAGAAAVGVAGSAIVAVPAEMAPPAEPSTRDVALAASITIPLLDIHTPPPVEIIQQIFLTLASEANKLSAATSSKAQTIYTLPGLYTNFDQTGGRTLALTRVPGESIGTGLASAFSDTNTVSLLGLLNSAGSQARASDLDLTAFTGGAQGIGGGLDGVLSKGARSQQAALGNIAGFSNGAKSVLGAFDGEVAAFPFDGFKAEGEAAPISRTGTTVVQVGSVQASTGVDTALLGTGGLCLGSATAKCGYISKLGGAAGLKTTLRVGNQNIISTNFPNQLVAQVTPGQFSVTGTVGGTVKVGNVELGQVIPVNIQIPNSTALMSSTSSKQQQSVRSSFLAVPRNLGSDNGTASTGRHAARDAVNSVVSEVKAAVKSVTNSKPKHAKSDSDE